MRAQSFKISHYWNLVRARHKVMSRIDIRHGWLSGMDHQRVFPGNHYCDCEHVVGEMLGKSQRKKTS